MKVWILSVYDYDEYNIIHVYDMEEKANDKIKEITNGNLPFHDFGTGKCYVISGGYERKYNGCENVVIEEWEVE